VHDTGRISGRHGAKSGFTLIEVAFVMVILGLLIGLGAQLLPMLVKQNKLKDNRVLVKEAKTAVIGYALATGRLPYASANTGGNESAGRLNGYLPWATLGIPGKDPYSTTLFYAVDSHLCSTTSAAQLKTRLADLISGTLTPDLFSDGTNIKAAFIVLSAGEDFRVNPPNDDNNNTIVDIFDNNRFASPYEPFTASYDDVLEAVSLAYLHGLLP